MPLVNPIELPDDRIMRHLQRYPLQVRLLLGGLLTIAIVPFLPPFQAEVQGNTYQKEKAPPVRSEMIVSNRMACSPSQRS